jgi:hypothetical protein
VDLGDARSAQMVKERLFAKVAKDPFSLFSSGALTLLLVTLFLA